MNSQITGTIERLRVRLWMWLGLFAPLVIVSCSPLAPSVATPSGRETATTALASIRTAEERATPGPVEAGRTVAPAISATPEPAASPTVRETPTNTRTPTLTNTPTRTRTPTPSQTPTKTPLPTGPITRIDTRFHSAALGEDRRILVYLPPGYSRSPTWRYPVLYMLHGYGGCNNPIPEWEQWGLKDKLEKMTQAGQVQPMIVALPDGFMADCQPSYFFNHGPGTDGKRWGDSVWQDAVRYMDTTYRTLPRRESRAIGGLSLGGQGALSLALIHPEVFATVGGHSPSMRGVNQGIPFINDFNYFNQYDPIWLVQNTEAARQLSIWLDVGTDDKNVRNCGSGSNRCAEAFHALLVSRGIPHEWHDTWPGAHEGSYWAAHVPDYLTWYSTKLVGQ